jgi:hypothetical protein
MNDLDYQILSAVVARRKVVRIDLLSKPVKIHVCKDRTLSIVMPGGKPFNGVALPVYSVDTREDAENLIMLVGIRQYWEHPLLPGQPWMKIDIDFKIHLELDDLAKVQEKLHLAHRCLK